jgi:cytochrome c peroxidase
MRTKTLLLFIFTLLLCLGFTQKSPTPLYFEVPKGWPKPTYDFKKNPLTEESFQLGKSLFYDPYLSSDGMVSCASCHFQGNAFSHRDHHASHGVGDKMGTRNSIALVNLAWSKNFMWDGAITDLVKQPANPITNPEEMNETMENVIAKLSKSKQYPLLFHNAFGSPEVTKDRILLALSHFLVMIKSTDTKYDKVMRKEDHFTKEEAHGYAIFKEKCASCHTEPLFTNNSFENNGLPMDSVFKDRGRMQITHSPKDALKFKVPSLRNSYYSADYMHDGRFSELKDVLNHYNTISPDKNTATQLKKPMHLTTEDIEDLYLFLGTLLDKGIMRNLKLAYTKDLYTEKEGIYRMKQKE